MIMTDGLPRREDCITLAEAAALCGVEVHQLRYRMLRGQIEAVKFPREGNLLFVRRVDAEALRDQLDRPKPREG